MLSEDFDKKMREAADRHHPQYDERAWGEMKKLLDKHMPVQEERKRRGLFLLFFLLLLGSGAAIYFIGFRDRSQEPLTEKVHPDPAPVPRGLQQPDSHPILPEEKTVKPAQTLQNQEEDITLSGPNEQRTVQPATQKKPLPEIVTDPGEKIAVPMGVSTSRATNSPQKKSKPANKKTTGPGLPGQDLSSGTTITNNPEKNRKDQPADSRLTATKAVPASDITASQKVAVDVQKEPVKDQSDPKKPEAEEPLTGKVTAKVASPPSQPAKADEKKKAQDAASIRKLAKPKSSFFIAASAAPDVSFTSGDELGRLKLTGGFGLGYTYRGRLTLRTGLYTGRKIYTASPENYKRSAWFNQYYPNLQRVEADCRVQEIPIMLSYHFGQQGRRQWFAAAGVSTLIMKEETYNYYYKYTAWGQVVNRSHTTYNQNKHPFSILTVSAGYQHSLGKRFSILAEPYLKLPLRGVGNGKVRLNSTGVMFTLTASPFGK